MITQPQQQHLFFFLFFFFFKVDFSKLGSSQTKRVSAGGKREGTGCFCRTKEAEKESFLLLFFGGVVRGEGFSAKALEKRLPFVVRARMPLA